MKLQIRDLKKNTFTLDVEPSTKIPEVRKMIADHHGAETGAIRMIHSGKVLADEKDIAFYNIKETDHIIAMVQKPKAKVADAAPSTPAPSAPAATPAAPGPAPASVQSATQEPPATPTPAGSAAVPPAERRFDDTSPMMSAADRATAVAGMESMGFDRATAERALRAAFWNADRAVEFCLNGIPENLQQQEAARLPPAPAAPAQPQAAATSAPQQQQQQQQQVPTGNQDSSEPVNLFEAAAAAQNRGGSGGSGATAGATEAARGAGGAAPGAGPGNLDFLRENPMFRQLRSIVQAQPSMLESVLQQVSAANPQLAQMISAHPEHFLSLLTEGDDGDVEQLPPGAREISVSEEERMAIERLCQLGFERDLVIQAYFACDKNEELAANFLFDQPPEEDDAGGES